MLQVHDTGQGTRYKHTTRVKDHATSTRHGSRTTLHLCQTLTPSYHMTNDEADTTDTSQGPPKTMSQVNHFSEDLFGCEHICMKLDSK